VVSVVSFTAILWHLSFPVTVFGIQIARALFWIVIVYVVVATVFAFVIGRPLIRLSFRNEQRNAIFRYALVRLRDAGEAVGFYRGERAERVELDIRFADVITNYRAYVRRTVAFTGFNVLISQPIGLLPLLIQAPRLFAGSIKLGGVMQATQAFGTVQDSLSFFRNVYDAFASYRAVILRLHGLVEANEKTRQLPQLQTAATADGSVELEEVEVRTPHGLQLVDPLNFKLDPGASMVIVGRSGSGKTTLLRSLAQLWPFTSGMLRYPSADNATMFLSQLPYVPLGNFRAVLSYPAAEGDIPDDKLSEVLTKVSLAHLHGRLDEVQDWAKVLSPGEQQRVAFGRVLLTRPRAVFLDEATSALDAGLEYALYQLVRTELPDTVVVSVSHRNTVEPHHKLQLALLGDGAWRVGKVGEQPTPV
jgi:putative ATP-binding cassette transporter